MTISFSVLAHSWSILGVSLAFNGIVYASCACLGSLRAYL